MKRWEFGKKAHVQEEPDELDRLLYKYMPKYEEQLMAELESNVDYDYEFSDNYKKKMAQLVVDGKMSREKFEQCYGSWKSHARL